MSLSGDMDTAVDTAATAGGTSDSATSAAPTTPAPAAPVKTSPVPAAGGSPAPASSAAPRVPGATSTPAGKTPAAATVPTDLDGVEAELLKNPKGAIPVPRVQEILANVRQKAAASARTEAQASLKTTLGVDPATFVQLGLKNHVQAFIASPINYFRDLGLTLQRAGVTLPTFEGAPSAAAPAARPAARPAAAALPAEPPGPDMFATLEDGSRAETYSAGAVRKMLEWQMSQLEQRFGQRLAPLEHANDQLNEREVTRIAWDSAEKEFREAQTWPHFETIRKDVHALMTRDARYSLEGAYSKIFREKIYPNLEATHRQKFNQDLKAAPAATTVSPSTAVARTGPPATKRNGRAPDWDAAIAGALEKHAPH